MNHFRYSTRMGPTLLWLALGFAYGCHKSESPPEPAPIEEQALAPTDVAAPETQPYFEHEIQRGETLWTLSRTYGVPFEQIREANGFNRREARSIQAGQTLRIPGIEPEPELEPELANEADATDQATDTEPLPSEAESTPPAPIDTRHGAWHELGHGETLWDVSRTYDIALSDIMDRNHFSDDDARRLHAGERVFVPGATQPQVRRAARAHARERQRPGVHHTLAANETIWDLARQYGVSVAEIMSANQLGPRQVNALPEGQRLLIPGIRPQSIRSRSSDVTAPAQRRLTRHQRRDQRRGRRLGFGTRAAAHQLLHGQVRRSWIRAAGRGHQLPGTLRWPVANGRFVRGYGSGEDGYHLATDIAGDIGWNVRAAAPGIVGYAGHELRGFGNVVLVVHPGGWVTMYAHNSILFVVEGQHVRTGTILAEVGSTGRSTGPHVHFELIFNGQNCDPLHLWRPGVHHRAGTTHPDPLVWEDPAHRPAGIRCAPRRHHPNSTLVSDEVVPSEDTISTPPSP